MKDFLTATMRAFVRERVRDGFVASEEEFLRFLVWQEIIEWECLRHRAFPSHEKPRGGT